MKQALILFLFLANAHAQNLDSVVHILNSDNVSVESQLCAPDAMDVEIQQSCAREICGPSDSNPPAYVEGNELADFRPTREVQAEIDRSLTLMNSANAAWSQEVGQYINALGSNIQRNSGEIDPALVSDIDELFGPYLNYRVVNRRIVVVSTLPDDASVQLKAGVQEWLNGKEREAQTDPLLRMRLGLITPAQGWRDLKKDFQDFQTEVNRRNEPELSEVYRSLVEPFNMAQLPYSHMINISDFFKRVKMLAKTPTTPAPPYTQNVYDSSCKEACLKALQPLVTKAALNNRINFMRNRLLDDQIRYNQGCRTGLMLQANYGQLPGQQEAAQAIFESALDKVTSQSWWSSHTKEAFREFALNEARVSHDGSTAERITTENIRLALDYGRRNLRWGNTLGTSLGSIFKLSQQGGNMFANALPFCPSPQFLATDSFEYKLDKPYVKVSGFSCAHPGIGEGIQAHELGHALSVFMTSDKVSSGSSTKYQQIRSCISNLSTLKSTHSPGQAPIVFPGDFLTSEEDMADWIGFNSVRSQKPVACSLMKRGDNGLYDPTELNMLPHHGSTHSSSLLRAMREWYNQKGSLTPACTRLARASVGVVEVKKCQ